MNQSYFMMLILYCLHKIDGQRTIYAILHLLNGKKSSQTIQDAHFFQLTNLFNTFPDLTRTELEKVVAKLEAEGWIEENPEENCRLTATGIEQMHAYFAKQPFPKALNGWKYHHLTTLFWRRLTLAIQVASHLMHRDSKYIPVQKNREVHQWLKVFLSQTGLSRDELGKHLYDELVRCLKMNGELDPSLLVLRLTGYQTIGLTSLQTAEKLMIDHDAYHLQFLGILHSMLEAIQLKQADFPLLSQFMIDGGGISPLTQSTRKTYNLLKKGLMVDEIASIRHLKKSTIEDHIVEIALNVSSFDISPFVGKENKELITQAAQSVTSKQLKHIRQIVPKADYFEIRLVLARGGEKM